MIQKENDLEYLIEILKSTLQTDPQTFPRRKQREIRREIRSESGPYLRKKLGTQWNLYANNLLHGQDLSFWLGRSFDIWGIEIAVRGDKEVIEDQLCDRYQATRVYDRWFRDVWNIETGEIKDLQFKCKLYTASQSSGPVPHFFRKDHIDRDSRYYNFKISLYPFAILPPRSREVILARALIDVSEHLISSNVPCLVYPTQNRSYAFDGKRNYHLFEEP